MKTASRKDAAAQQDGGGQALGGLTARQHGERFADTRLEGATRPPATPAETGRRHRVGPTREVAAHGPTNATVLTREHPAAFWLAVRFCHTLGVRRACRGSRTVFGSPRGYARFLRSTGRPGLQRSCGSLAADPTAFCLSRVVGRNHSRGVVLMLLEFTLSNMRAIFERLAKDQCAPAARPNRT